jgi:hypothetical protein
MSQLFLIQQGFNENHKLNQQPECLDPIAYTGARAVFCCRQYVTFGPHWNKSTAALIETIK